MSIDQHDEYREKYKELLGTYQGVPGALRKLYATTTRWLPAILIMVSILGAWEAYVQIFDVQKWLLPAPSAIAATIGNSAGLLSGHTLVTLNEIVIGFAIALLMA